MRTTLTLDDELMRRAQKLTGITEESAVVEAGLESLVRQKSEQRLVKQDGSEPDTKDVLLRR